MSQSLEPIFRPAVTADFSPEWIANVRASLQRDGQATRPAEKIPVIEVQSINTGEWLRLNLPTNSSFFGTYADRDTVLELLVGKAK